MYRSNVTCKIKVYGWTKTVIGRPKQYATLPINPVGIKIHVHIKLLALCIMCITISKKQIKKVSLEKNNTEKGLKCSQIVPVLGGKGCEGEHFFGPLP